MPAQIAGTVSLYISELNALFNWRRCLSTLSISKLKVKNFLSGLWERGDFVEMNFHGTKEITLFLKRIVTSGNETFKFFLVLNNWITSFIVKISENFKTVNEYLNNRSRRNIIPPRWPLLSFMKMIYFIFSKRSSHIYGNTWKNIPYIHCYTQVSNSTTYFEISHFS